MYIYVYIYLYAYIPLPIYINIYIYIYVYVCMHICICICIYLYLICVSCHVLNRCRTTTKSLSFIWSTNMILNRLKENSNDQNWQRVRCNCCHTTSVRKIYNFAELLIFEMQRWAVYRYCHSLTTVSCIILLL